MRHTTILRLYMDFVWDNPGVLSDYVKPVHMA